MPWSVASFYAVEIAAALDHVHLTRIGKASTGLALRSLARECVWLDGGGHVKLRDFDHVGVLDATGRTRTPSGLLDYASPEQLRRGDHGAAVDWWGLGVLLYELLVGEPPFLGNDPVDSFKRCLSSNPDWCTRVFRRRIRPSAGARGLVDDLLAKDPRYRLGGSPALRGRGLVASPDGPPLKPRGVDGRPAFFKIPDDPETDLLPPRNPFSLRGGLDARPPPPPAGGASGDAAFGFY